LKATRFLPPLLAGMTLLLVGANAFPSVVRKHVLREERRKLERELRAEVRKGQQLEAELDALAHDPFYLERLVVETWKGLPRGATPFPALELDNVVVRRE
jgi:heme exporter protein D